MKRLKTRVLTLQSFLSDGNVLFLFPYFCLTEFIIFYNKHIVFTINKGKNQIILLVSYLFSWFLCVNTSKFSNIIIHFSINDDKTIKLFFSGREHLCFEEIVSTLQNTEKRFCMEVVNILIFLNCCHSTRAIPLNPNLRNMAMT